MRPAGLTLFATLLMALPAAAQTANRTKSAACDGTTQSEMSACAQDALQHADTALNASYRRLTARLSGTPAAARSLVEAQRAWIRFRDAECDFSTVGYEGGSIRPMLTSQCLERMTRQRTAALENHIHCLSIEGGC